MKNIEEKIKDIKTHGLTLNEIEITEKQKKFSTS